MNSIHCNICLVNYESDVVVPRVLDCGHSICTQCTTRCIQSSSVLCPVCRQSLTKSNATSYPINYELMQIVESLKKTTTTENNLKKELTKYLPSVTDELNSIQKLLADDDFDVDKTEKALSNLSKLLGNITSGRSLKDSMTHKRSDYESEKEFIYDIYRFLCNSEEAYAVTIIDGEIKYARLRISDIVENMIFLHAFDHPVKKSGINTIWFNDLQRIFKRYRVTSKVFLEIDHMKLIIKIDFSPIYSQFWKYCSGECGPVYKGAKVTNGTYTKNSGPHILKVDNFMLNRNEATGNLDFTFDSIFSQNYEISDTVCIGYINGSFKLIEYSGKAISNPFKGSFFVGKIEEQKGSFNLIWEKLNSNSKITDSGIILDLDKELE